MKKHFLGTAATSAQGKKANGFELVMGYARKKFQSFPIQTTEMKRNLIEAGMNQKAVQADMFFGEFNNAISMLLESTKFINDCISNQLCPLNVAQHTVFCGKSYVYEVLNVGLNATFETLYLPQMKDPIFQFDQLVPYDGNLRLRKAMDFERILALCRAGKMKECATCSRHEEVAAPES